VNVVTDDDPPTALERRAHDDLPYSARHFDRWLRARLIEHWYGLHFWAELDRADFGILQEVIHPDRGLVADVVALLLTGGENLTIILWAIETARPLDDVVTILSVLDVNTRRLPELRALLLDRVGAERAPARGHYHALRLVRQN